MSEPLDPKTAAGIGGGIVAGIGLLKWFARWRTPEDASFDRSQRDDLLARAKRAEERSDVMEAKYDELLERIEKMHQELIAEKESCFERLAQMEKRMQTLVEAREACDREGCPSRMSPSGEFRVSLRQIEEDRE